MQAPEELAHLAPRASRREIPPYLDTVVFASGHGHSVAQPPPPANHPPAHAAPGSRPAPSSPPGPALTPGRPGLLVDPVQLAEQRLPVAAPREVPADGRAGPALPGQEPIMPGPQRGPVQRRQRGGKEAGH